MSAVELERLTAELIDCERCPRLVEWRNRVAVEKRASYIDDEYWGRPVPGFGDPDAAIVVVGLAPAAHGANRTGRMFTGDRSGEWLFRALHRAGLANRPESVAMGDGLRLSNVWVTAPVRCAPPANRPTPAERDACAGWFDRELDALDNARVYVCLGQFGYQSLWHHLARGTAVPHPRPRFGHGVEVLLDGGAAVLLSYHVSQQNTFTGRLTEPMLDAVFMSAVDLAGRPGAGFC